LAVPDEQLTPSSTLTLAQAKLLALDPPVEVMDIDEYSLEEDGFEFFRDSFAGKYVII
jgi:hypothetical protein